jgi:hypothetical protein
MVRILIFVIIVYIAIATALHLQKRGHEQIRWVVKRIYFYYR